MPMKYVVPFRAKVATLEAFQNNTFLLAKLMWLVHFIYTKIYNQNLLCIYFVTRLIAIKMCIYSILCTDTCPVRSYKLIDIKRIKILERSTLYNILTF